MQISQRLLSISRVNDNEQERQTATRRPRTARQGIGRARGGVGICFPVLSRAAPLVAPVHRDMRGSYIWREYNGNNGWQAMTEPKPEYDTGAYHAALDCVRMHLEKMEQHRQEILAIMQGLEQSGYTTVPNPLIDWPEPIDAAGHVTVSGAGIGLGGEERD